jgi:ribosome biogenesis GTPase
MSGKPKKTPREKDLTSRYFSGQLSEDVDNDRVAKNQFFTSRNAGAEQNKIMKTSAMRAADLAFSGDLDALPLGEVIQVHSLFCDVLHDGVTYLCVIRKTMNKIADTAVVVGDRVHFRTTGILHDTGKPEAVLEKVLPRDTVLTRADSFKGQIQHPIVANAKQMLIVVSLAEPTVKWGLIDRMIIAAEGGGLKPIICLNKIDLLATDKTAQKEMPFAAEALAHYQSLGVASFQASIHTGAGLDDLRNILRGQTTVLAGHSGVGKSSLVMAVQPQIDIRVGAISGYTGKGRHTTTSARRYPCDFGGAVIDTPGVKLFGGIRSILRTIGVMTIRMP